MDNKTPPTNKAAEPTTTPNPFPHFEKLQRSINAYWDELAGYENAMYERARTTTADLAGLAKDSIAYMSALSEEWRRQVMKMTSTFAPKA
jgi:hypothetical protein